MNEMSNCCSSSVINPSGEGNEGICADCGEHCSIVRFIEVKCENNNRRFVAAPDMRWTGKDFELVRHFLIDITDIPY